MNYESLYSRIGYQQPDKSYSMLDIFHEDNIKLMSNEITRRLKSDFDLNMIVTDKVIIGVLNQFYQNYRPYHSGDIYTKYTMDLRQYNVTETLIIETINFILQNIYNELLNNHVASTLDIWKTNRLDWNEKVKIKEKQLTKFNWIPLEELGNNIPQMN